MRAKSDPPAGNQGANENPGGALDASLAEPLPGLHECGPIVRALVYAWYHAGVSHGIPIGRQQEREEADAQWAVVAEKVRKLGSPGSVPYSELCHRRGESGRAARARVAESRVMYG